jgi:sugar O-acyltransferase (sialic acid O-acetyltransferase NeuD family)
LTGRPIIFWGATGHAKVLHEFVGRLGYELVALFDNALVEPPIADVPLYQGQQGFAQWRSEHPGDDYACLVAIGGARGRDRVRIQRELELAGIKTVTVVHPTAFIAADASLAQGCQVLAKAVVGVQAVLGEACIINTAASVDHECVLGNGVHLAPGAVLCGCVRIGDHVLVGPNAVVLPRLTIGRDCVIGAGAVVTHDVPDGVVVYGNPARIQRENIL